MSVIADSDFGTRVRTRLRGETVIWLTTTGADGTPQPNPVWFFWEEEGDALLVYSANDAKRLDHIAVRPRVSLNFDGDGKGGNVIVIAGTAEQALDAPPVSEHAAYLEKYADHIARIGEEVNSFAQKYSVALRIRMTRVRGF